MSITLDASYYKNAPSKMYFEQKIQNNFSSAFNIADIQQSDKTSTIVNNNKTPYTTEEDLNCSMCGEINNPQNLPCKFYKPSNYSEEDPVYIAKIYPWDGSDPIIREIHLNNINFSNIDEYETFAYGIYLKKQGKIPWLNDILTAYDQANYQLSDDSSSFNKVNIIQSIKEDMNEGLKNRYYEQYLRYKSLFNLLTKQTKSF